MNILAQNDNELSFRLCSSEVLTPRSRLLNAVILLLSFALRSGVNASCSKVTKVWLISLHKASRS